MFCSTCHYSLNYLYLLAIFNSSHVVSKSRYNLCSLRLWMHIETLAPDPLSLMRMKRLLLLTLEADYLTVYAKLVIFQSGLSLLGNHAFKDC